MTRRRNDRGSTTTTTEAPPCVLLVDDKEANLLALEGYLGDLGCQLVRATSGNEALRQLLKREFALMLLDVQMPEMDGYEVARYSRENPSTRDVPIIFVTATLDTPENALRSYGTGAVDCLFKPLNPHILRSKVRVFLDLHRGRKRLVAEVESHRRTLASLEESNEALRRARDAAEAANRELEAFSYSVAHDLRAPLRRIDGFSVAVLEDYGDRLDGEGRGYLESVKESAQEMNALIDALLSLSRVARAEMHRQAVDLTEICRKIATRLQASEPNRLVRFTIEDGVLAECDEILLGAVLENLLGNAWKFTRKRDAARIEFGRVRGEPATYFVRDDGAGFDPSYAGKLFGAFQRLHSPDEFEGTGIGLATVQRIVHRHGGRVWAEGRPGEGATFFFTLGEPLSHPSADERSASRAAPDGSTP